MTAVMQSGDGAVLVAWLAVLGAICWAFWRAGVSHGRRLEQHDSRIRSARFVREQRRRDLVDAQARARARSRARVVSLEYARQARGPHHRIGGERS